MSAPANTAASVAAASSVAAIAAPSASVAAAAAPAKPADPNLDHLSSATFEHVYEPCEDSYLLMDALYTDLECNGWKERCGDRRGGFRNCMEIGPGSGIIISYLSSILRRRGWFLAIDINPHACRTTLETMRRNRVRAGDVMQGDLSSCCQPRLAGKLDILIFNPPYVPTPASELLGEGISRSWAGGEKGREILDQLLPRVQHLLAPRGVFYCVLLSSNLPDEVAAILQAQGGFKAEMVMRRKAGIEDLQIVRYWRPQLQESSKHD